MKVVYFIGKVICYIFCVSVIVTLLSLGAAIILFYFDLSIRDNRIFKILLSIICVIIPQLALFEMFWINDEGELEL